ncbi:MAG: EpsI family protein [Nitrospiraceae bacterium]|jgi:EpsI family protein|nr:EpsI family protein [Nitrospiraceae bacterium]
MKATLLISIVAGVLMVSTSSLSMVLRPTKLMAEGGPSIDLEALIPRQVGSWQVDGSVMPLQPAPDAQAVLNKIYSQILSRTYVNDRGDRVMLSVAYGGDQSDSMQVHKPEVCYPAQGFSVQGLVRSALATSFGQLPVNKLVAVQGPRTEPITYWITVGDKVARTGLDQKLAQLQYGLTGRIPDGIIFRVSSIDRDENRAYRIQAQFIDEILAGVPAAERHRLIGAIANEP